MRSRELKVIYPCVDTKESSESDLSRSEPIWPDKKILLSINRFEGKKNLALAIRAYAGLSAAERSRAKLVLAGGFDPRSVENNVTHRHLQELSDSLSLSHATFRSKDTALTDASTDNVDVLFLLSIPGELKVRLLHTAGILVYTPTNEHFGIVPLEAMLAGIPVLATNTGGPLETIYDGRTGWLRSPDKIEAWTDVMRKPLIPSSADNLKAMGQKGRERVLAEFSQTKMTQLFDQEIQRMVQSNATRPSLTPQWLVVAIVVTIIAIILGFAMMKLTLWAVGQGEGRDLTSLADKATHTARTIAATATSASREEL